MSVVNNYVVIGSLGDDLEGQLALIDFDRQRFGKLVGEGGSKVYEWEIFGMAGNRVSLSVVAGTLARLKLREPDAFLLVYQGQEDDRPTVVRWGDLPVVARAAID